MRVSTPYGHGLVPTIFWGKFLPGARGSARRTLNALILMCGSRYGNRHTAKENPGNASPLSSSRQLYNRDLLEEERHGRM